MKVPRGEGTQFQQNWLVAGGGNSCGGSKVRRLNLVTCVLDRERCAAVESQVGHAPIFEWKPKFSHFFVSVMDRRLSNPEGGILRWFSLNPANREISVVHPDAPAINKLRRDLGFDSQYIVAT